MLKKSDSQKEEPKEPQRIKPPENPAAAAESAEPKFGSRPPARSWSFRCCRRPEWWWTECSSACRRSIPRFGIEVRQCYAQRAAEGVQKKEIRMHPLCALGGLEEVGRN